MTSDRIVTATAPRPRGFIAEWRPQSRTRALLEQVDAVLAAYPSALTARQIFYALVANHGFPKTEAAYSSLLEALNRARRAGRIPFAAIREEGRTEYPVGGFDDGADLEAYVDALLNDGRFDPGSGQPVQLMVFVEAAGMARQIADVAGTYGAAVLSSSGFDSLTAKHDLACTIADAGRPVVVLHVGDHDPSGAHLYQSLQEDVAAFIVELGGEATFRRIAVLPEHIARYGLPTAPQKATDRRAFYGQTVQCEALPPDVLASLVRQACDAHFDREAYDVARSEFEAARDDLRRRMNGRED